MGGRRAESSAQILLLQAEDFCDRDQQASFPKAGRPCTQNAGFAVRIDERSRKHGDRNYRDY